MKNVFRTLSICLVVLMAGCNSKIPPLSTNATVIAFGDSLTLGLGIEDKTSYPSQLASLSGLTVVNSGVAGEVSSAGLARLPGILDYYRPELLILCHGTSDFLQSLPSVYVDANIRAMIEVAEQRDIPVLLLGVPDLKGLIVSARMFRRIELETDAFFLEDIISDVLARPAMLADSVHPNKTGNTVIANAIYDYLKRMEAI